MNEPQPIFPSIKTVFFDAAGTLFHLPKGVGWHYGDVAARHGAVLSEQDLNRAFRNAWKRSTPPVETRIARPDDDRSWWRALVDDVLDECSGEPLPLDRDRYFAELYDEFARPGIWELYPDVVETLEFLAGRFRLGVLSNFDGRLRPVLADLGVAHYFQDWIISSEVGADKPSPWIFEKALASAGISASEALHVGDDPVCDWEAAASAGWCTFRLDRPQNGLSDLRSWIAVAEGGAV